VEATIRRWLKHEGDTVNQGEALVELETDKVNMEVGADQSGVLQKIVKQEGDTVAVGEVLGVIGESSQAPAAQAGDGQKIPSEQLQSEPVTSERQKVSTGQLPPTTTSADQVIVTPLAAPRGREERIRLSRRRQTIAQRLVEAQHSAAMLTTFNEIDMSAVMEVRSRRKDTFKERHNVSLGFMSFFTKAVVGALKAFPRLNAEIQGNEMVLKRYYDIGIAVGAEEGLVVPVLRDADRKSFAEIEQEVAALANKARENSL